MTTSAAVADLQRLHGQCSRIFASQRLIEKLNINPTLQEVRDAAWIEFIKDDKGIMLAVSNGYTEMTGITSQSYEGRTDVEMWGEDGQIFSARDAYVRETGNPLETVEAWLNRKAQKYQCGMVIKLPYPLPNGRLGTRGKVHRDSLRWIDQLEYQRLKSYDAG